MKKFKKVLCLALAGATALSFIGCGSDTVSYEPLPDDDDTVYQITICQSESTDYYNNITNGFQDALTDLFGEAHIALDVQVAGADNTTDSICQNAVASETQLLYTNGATALASAISATESTPVVATGIVDFQSALHIITDGNSNWDKKSGSNVTGVPAIPPMDDQLSLLIESTPGLETVGILYSADDLDAIYQNEILEKYLDQAGIPWKEYEIPTSTAVNENEAAIDTGSAITPSKVVAPSAKEGSNMNVESIGENSLINGINSPDSTRTSKISEFWYGPKGTVKPDYAATTDDANTSDNALNAVIGSDVNENEEEVADTFKSLNEVLGEDATTEDIVTYASSECSALFIPSRSLITDQMETIGSIAAKAGVVTVGGDSTIGANTLVTLYNDPYNMGYAAGKQAYRILVNGENPGDIKIVSAPGNSQKLYNAEVASVLGREFPKSFQEIHEYLTNYALGSLTTRIANDEVTAS